MAWNLNNKSQDYKLSATLTNQLIDTTGVPVQYVKTTLIGVDSIFNEHTNITTDLSGVYEVYVKPENPEGFDDNDMLSKFGFLSFTSINLFISHNSMEEIFPNIQEIPSTVGDLILLPSGKWLEIVDIEVKVPGINNMYVYKNQKNVYILKCKPYSYDNDQVEGVVDQLSMENDESLSVPDLSDIFNMDIPQESKDVVEAESTKGDDTDLINPIFGELG